MSDIPPAGEMPAVASNVLARARFRMEALRSAGVAIGCIGLFIIFSALTPNFYSPSNLLEIMLQSSINAILAVGMTLVVMCKGIDLSVGSIVGLSSMITASVLPSGLPLAVLAGLVVGVACGLLNGVVIAKLKMPDFIATLGTMSIYRGAALIFSSGQPIYQIEDDFRAIFNGTVGGIPSPVVIAVVFAVLAYLLVRFTTLGEHVIAVGGNEEAARLSGGGRRPGQDHGLRAVGLLLGRRRLRACRAPRRRRADRRNRLRTAGHRRLRDRRRQPLRR